MNHFPSTVFCSVDQEPFFPPVTIVPEVQPVPACAEAIAASSAYSVLLMRYLTSTSSEVSSSAEPLNVNVSSAIESFPLKSAAGPVTFTLGPTLSQTIVIA